MTRCDDNNDLDISKYSFSGSVFYTQNKYRLFIQDKYHIQNLFEYLKKFWKKFALRVTGER